MARIWPRRRRETQPPLVPLPPEDGWPPLLPKRFKPLKAFVEGRAAGVTFDPEHEARMLALWAEFRQWRYKKQGG